MTTSDTGIIHPTAAEHIRCVGATAESLLADDTTAEDLATGGISDDEIDDLRASLVEARRARCVELLGPDLAENALVARELRRELAEARAVAVAMYELVEYVPADAADAHELVAGWARKK